MSQEQPTSELPSPAAAPGGLGGEWPPNSTEGGVRAALDVPPAATTSPTLDLQAQFDALHLEMEQRATEAEQRRIDLEAQLQQARAEIEAISQQLAHAAIQQVDALRRAAIAENAGQVIPELVHGNTPEEIESSVTLARTAYQRIAQDLRVQTAAQVPTGASPIAPPPIEDLSPMAKITAALNRGGANNR